MFDIEKWNRNDWIEASIVQNHFGMTFKECFKYFEFSRTAEWNKYPLNGQHIICYFRKGQGNQADN